MRRSAKQLQSIQRGGFAIVVVLASLMVLTALFAIASQRSMAHVQSQNAEQHLLKRQADNTAILTLLLSLDAEVVAASNITLPAPYAETLIYAQDVGGLIDVNTASSELLGLMFDALDFPQGAATTLQRWREQEQRFLRVEDLIRITGADPAIRDPLLQIATVHSGRRGVNAAIAPDSVLQIAGINHETPPSNTNFAIYILSSERPKLIGVVSLIETQDQARVLEVR